MLIPRDGDLKRQIRWVSPAFSYSCTSNLRPVRNYQKTGRIQARFNIRLTPQ